MRSIEFHDVNQKITGASCVIRATASQKGRVTWLSPESSAMQYLSYRRIILGPGDHALSFPTGECETGLICLNGRASVEVSGKHFELSRYDSLYVPREYAVRIVPSSEGCDLAEISAPVERHHPLQFVSFKEVQADAGLHFKTGAPTFARDLHILIGKNVEAGRLVAGVTFSDPGNWTSWPPHEHAEMLEEAYLYIDMPKPSWGVQFVYTNPGEPELVAVVREGDCVVIPKGYHPNVAAPGGSINFLWMMAARREGIDRQFGVVNVQPDYAANGSGLDTGRATK